MGATAGDDGVGLAELIGVLSLGIDLGFGQPMEHVIRQCWIALERYPDGAFEVEVSDASGATMALFVASEEDLELAE